MKDIANTDRRILFLNVFHEECILVFVSHEVYVTSFTLFSNAAYGSSLYQHHLVSAALDILNIERINFLIYVHFCEN